MKKTIYLIAIGLAFLASCTGIKSTTRGLENEAFIEIIGNSDNYKNGVDVKIDDKISFKAVVNKPKTTKVKSQVYAISTGSHTLTISSNNNIIYSKQIFVSSQETKLIELP